MANQEISEQVTNTSISPKNIFTTIPAQAGIQEGGVWTPAPVSGTGQASREWVGLIQTIRSSYSLAVTRPDSDLAKYGGQDSQDDQHQHRQDAYPSQLRHHVGGSRSAGGGWGRRRLGFGSWRRRCRCNSGGGLRRRWRLRGCGCRVRCLNCGPGYARRRRLGRLVRAGLAGPSLSLS